MQAQLNALLGVMDRLTAGDTGVEVPFQDDRTEVGRIAAALEAFRGRLIEAEDERRRAEQANAALRESEARYRMLADNTGDIILHYDLEFRALYVSPSIKHLGYEPDVLMTQTFPELIHPDERAEAVARRTAVMAGEAVKPISARIRTADGGWKWFESTLTPVIDGAGDRVGFISTLRDIGERKLAEQAMIDSEARYRMLADNSSDVILHYGPKFERLYISPSVRQFGYTPEQLMGIDTVDMVHPDDLAISKQRRAEAMQGLETKPIAIRLRTADGRWNWFEGTLTTVRDAAGAVAGFISTLRDIHERKMAELALIDGEARYRMLADNIGDVLLRYDTNLRIDYVSPSVRQWGYSREDFIGQPIGHFVHPDDEERIARRRAALLRGEPVPSGECRVRRADGSWIWAESSPALIRDDGGAVLGIMLVLRDIEQRKAAEQARIDSETRYRILADNASDVLLRYDATLHIEYASPSVRQWGYTPEDFIGQRAGVFVHPDDAERIAERRQAMIGGGVAETIEARIRSADGRWTWVESRPAQIRGEDGAVMGVVVVLRDINERKLAEAALIESEARYRMLADNITDVMMRYDVDGLISYVSPSVRQWGYAPADWVGKVAGHLIHPDDKVRIVQRRAAMLAGEDAPRAEVRIQRADGQWTWIESNPALIRDDAGAVVGVVLIMRDINERKLAEQALIESEARYRILADNTSDIIQRFDADGVVRYVSPSVRQLGYEPEFFVGRPTAQIISGEDLPDVVRRREDLLSGKAVPPMESRVRAADGRTVWLESRPSTVFDHEGKLVGVVNVMRDVTERKAAETALQELNLELRRVARASALGAFAASLAHEINQPLAAAAVNGEAALRWLTADPVNYDRGLQASKRAVDAVRRAADVVGRLRALVTKEEPARAPFDAHDAIVEILALSAREAERWGVTVQARLEASLAQILGDRVQFQQVMINLVLNAIEAMHEVDGERLLVVGSRDGAEGLEIYVEDRGPGVEADKQAQIFESMFTTKIGGTGLGLAIAKSIVESHGGAIAMTPATPHGSVFSVRLPKVAAAKAGLRSA